MAEPAIAARQHGPGAPTLGPFLRLSRPFLARWATRAGLVALLALTLAQVGLAVLYNLWNAWLFDALEARDAAALWRQVGVFAGLVLLIVLSNAGQLAAKRRIAVAWRQALTERLLEAWLAEGRQWRLGQLADGPDNPDGRIAEDIRVATEHMVELAASLVFASVTIAAFLGILWSLSGVVTVLGVAVPGHMVWLAALYAAGGAAAAFAFGRPLTLATESRQRAEADLRFGLVRAREQAEGIAVARAEPAARGGLAARFALLRASWDRQSVALRNLTGFQSAYSTIAPILPVLVAAPRYLRGDLSLGGLMQVAQGFQQLVVALSWPVDQAARLAEWHASAERVLALAEALEQIARETGGLRAEEAGEALVLEGVILRRPDGVALSAPVTATLPRGARVEVSGEPGAVPALVLAIAGLWPWGEGRLVRPAAARLAVLPRDPWLPEGRLDAVLAGEAAVPRGALAAALEVVGLAALESRLEESADWGAALGAEQRLRLAFARLLLGRPDLVVIEEIAGQLGEAEAARLLGLLTRALPDAILLAADHGALGLPGRLELAPPVGVPPGQAARAAARRRASRFAAWLRRGFGHRRE
jgi:putative ATP-binding cassette transporter